MDGDRDAVRLVMVPSLLKLDDGCKGACLTRLPNLIYV